MCCLLKVAASLTRAQISAGPHELQLSSVRRSPICVGNISYSARKRLAGNSFHQACMSAFISYMCAFVDAPKEPDAESRALAREQKIVDATMHAEDLQTLLSDLRRGIEYAEKVTDGEGREAAAGDNPDAGCEDGSASEAEG